MCTICQTNNLLKNLFLSCNFLGSTFYHLSFCKWVLSCQYSSQSDIYLLSLKIFSNEGSKKYCPCLTISFRKESRLLSFFVLSFDINYVCGVLLELSVFLRFHHLANFLFRPSYLQNLYFHLFHCYHKVILENEIMVDYLCCECLIY